MRYQVRFVLIYSRKGDCFAARNRRRALCLQNKELNISDDLAVARVDCGGELVGKLLLTKLSSSEKTMC